MSDSSLSDSTLSEGVLEQALRNAVREVYRSGDLDDLTIKRIRKSVEVDLDLQDDFFKTNPAWKERSKNVIQSEVDSQADANANGEHPSTIPSPRPPPKSKKAQPNLPKPQKPNRDFRGTKRTSSEKAEPKKRRKRETPDTETSAGEEKEVPRERPITKSKERASGEKTRPIDRQQKEGSSFNGSSSEEEDVPSKKPMSRAKKGTSRSSHSPKLETHEEVDHISKNISSHSNANGRQAEASESEMSEVLDEAPKTKSRKRKLGSAKSDAKADGAKANTSDSEMSEVLDEAPKTKGRKRKSDSAKPGAKKTEILKRKTNSEHSNDPDAEEKKRLQGWLIKCGIRKMWHRELAPYDTSKAKISHLKSLLADAGMTGRYSAEKAKDIKEKRELQADLEAVQEGAKQWGKVETEGEDETSGRPKRRLARGLQELNFLNDDDGEETD